MIFVKTVFVLIVVNFLLLKYSCNKTTKLSKKTKVLGLGADKLKHLNPEKPFKGINITITQINKSS